VLSLDDDGNYRVHGRIKETIIRGGENIYAPDLEDDIIEHPKIENVAVIGMPDERLGERPMAFVELREGETELTLEELTEFLDERGIAVFKRPERLEIVENLPRTEVGKIAKNTLQERITAKLKEEGQLPEEY
jgi:non-ribosomal peptide synthetase component E (peptide arylation enzyme)